MKVLKVFLGVIVSVALLIVLAYGVTYPRMPSEESQSYERLTAGKFAVGIREFSIVDHDRTTPSNGDVRERSSRQLRATVWYPEDDGAIAVGLHPLVLYSHGFGSTRSGGSFLASHLAANGYLVAAVEFPLSHLTAPGGATPLDVANQPGDVSFLIDYLLSLSANPNSQFFERIDARRIGAVGMSLGGLTTMLVSFHKNLRDERIKAAIALAAPTQFFDESFFQTRPHLPFMNISGDYDYLAPYEHHGFALRSLHPTAWHLTVRTGSHAGFDNGSKYLRLVDHPDRIGCRLLLSFIDTDLIASDAIPILLGGHEAGIAGPITSLPCSSVFDAAAMNPIRQHRLVNLAARAFFDMNLRQGEIAAAGEAYLRDGFVDENPEIEILGPDDRR